MPEVSPSKYVTMATWDDAPHLTRAQRDELWDSIPVHQRDARAKGIPQLGSGAIYPVSEEDITCDDFEIPEYWPCAFAMDVGWKCTAALWGAWDRQSDTVYLWSAYKRGQAEPATHVDAIKSRGEWIPGVIDPASRGRAQKDGVALYDEYVGMGLNLGLADNAVEAGIHAVYRRFVSGRLKIFKSLVAVFEEIRLYRRDENGKIVKENDHLMDCKRYLIMTGLARAMDRVTATGDDDWNESHDMQNRNRAGY